MKNKVNGHRCKQCADEKSKGLKNMLELHCIESCANLSQLNRVRITQLRAAFNQAVLATGSLVFCAVGLIAIERF